MTNKLHEHLRNCLENLDYVQFFEVLNDYFKSNSLKLNNYKHQYYELQRIFMNHGGDRNFQSEYMFNERCSVLISGLFGRQSNNEKDYLSSFFWRKKSLLKEGKITYAIPSEMNLKQAYTCSVKIAFDLETLLEDLNRYDNTYSEAENLLVSSKLKVDVYDVDNEFQIKWLCPQTQSLVKGKASEWVFSVKPLTKEESFLYFCVSAFLENGEDKPPHVKVFNKKITVKVNNSLSFIPSSLLPSVVAKDFELLTERSMYSSIKETIDKIVEMINEVEIYQAFEKIDEVMKDEKHPHIEVLRKGYIHGDAKFDFYDRFKTCVRCVLSETLATV